MGVQVIPKNKLGGNLEGSVGLRKDFCGWKQANFGEIKGLQEFEPRGINGTYQIRAGLIVAL